MTLQLDPRLWTLVVVELAVLGYLLARQFRSRTGLAPGGTSPAAWGLLGGLLPFVGLLLLVEATARPAGGGAHARSRDDEAEPPSAPPAPAAPLAVSVLPR